MEDPGQDNPSGNPAYRDPPLSEGSSSAGDQADLLQRVLEQSIERWSDDNDPIPIQLEPLLCIAKHHAGMPLTLDPIAVELIEAALTDSLGWGRQQPKQWRSISRQLAQTLVNDQRSFERMKQLWRRLQHSISQSDPEVC